MFNFYIRLIMLTPLLLGACTTLPSRDPAFAPVRPAALRPPMQNNGAIYQANYDVRLFEDQTARRVGDILTIKLQERTNAKKSADLDTAKDTSLTVTAPMMFGMSPATILGQSMETEISSSHAFTGAGGANQSNSLTGDISVTVVEVLPNGNLMIRGEKRVTLNQGDEFIRLSGIVRPVDIDATNTIPSSKVADATIMYTGEGAMADVSRMGWIARFFNSPWFPF